RLTYTGDKSMPQNFDLGRRSFLRKTGVAALAGIAGTTVPEIGTASIGPAAPATKFDFDTPYSRIGTDSTKWDQQIRIFGKDHIAVGMGIADMDFKTAPVITEALRKRLEHENWGYLDIPDSFRQGIVAWNKRRYGIDVNPESLVITTGVHPGLVA